ncbi:MAG: type II toxin-antitoxin system VapC family toxin [Bacteroidetes bacterium]|jgi:tRNA(fMet)-specific endonuclease VapC|nr:type II toxin-antitoxin system VapC family toxin [Bacteroidota bacterium]MBT6687211.1 type II toxin-antitoxin system VapC family toxin [Bacteroidota bacterium]MBT7144576.1 type II toxin-antitoxin system VapC family toxin [Bacteroidota bacterium]MBT7490776.1 type II toxin-antitoxin system VapC family toxin [Bacteroidota bacterium]
MDYLIDTNICIYYFKGQFGLKEKIENIGFENFAISEITLAELIYGAEKSQKVDKNLKVVEEFADQIEILPILNCMRIYGKEKARLKSIGKTIGDLDLFIGSTAIVNNLTMVTRNTREFERIEGISLEN